MDSNNSGDRSGRLETLAQQLRDYKEKQHEHEGETRSQDSILNAVSSTKKAAVLVCLFEGNDGDLRVILTQRSSKLSSHPGDVAFPGGKKEEGDADDIETALREAKEEIGLDPSLINVVTALEPCLTKVGMMVVPVIAILPDRKAFVPTLCVNEVETIFDAPLEMFLKDENRREVEKELMGDKYLLHFFDYKTEGKEYTISALTARILIKVASIVFNRPPAFLERSPNFWSRVVDNKEV